jgi:hypothetical protein
MAKIRNITLQQNDNGTYTILSFSNTAQLSIGQVVDNARLAYWASMPDVRFKVVAAPAERADDLDEENAQETSPVRVTGDFEIDSNPLAGQVRAMAAEFDSIMMAHAHERGWGTEKAIGTASQPDPGNHHLGLIGIAGKISRSGALALVRRETFRALNLNPDDSGKLASRAEALAALKNLVETPLPF